MASKKGNGPSNRGMGEAIVFLIMVAAVSLEMHLVFCGWWFVFDKWAKRNPITPVVVIIGLLMGPVTGFMALKSAGKRMGDETDEMGRGMRR